jgi:hypothetical protein
MQPPHVDRHAALSALIRWLAERLFSELVAEAAACSQNRHYDDHDSSDLRPVLDRPPARNFD